MFSTMQSLWQQQHLFLILVSSLGLVFIIKHFLFKLKASSKNTPPSPRSLPIIGNLHQLALPLHQTLFSLSKKYGPLMLLHLGQTPVVVVSSAEAAHEVMKTHDLDFASRHESKITKKLFYDSKDMAMAPYGEYWRQMKRIFVLQLLSNTKVRSFHVAREERTKKLMADIERSSPTMLNVSELLASLTFDMVCEVAFGKTKEVRGEKGEKFKKLLDEMMKIMGGFDLGEVFPWLAWIGSVSGKDSRIDKVVKGIDEILEDVIQEHIHRDEEGASDDEDFVDILLKIQKDKDSGVSLDRDGIKALVLDTFVGGTETTSTLLEWELSELLKHPKVMKKLQNEVGGIAKGKPNITKDDLEKLLYMKAVVKETLRLHPPVPISIPREARQDTKVMGYDVATKTMVIINLCAIGRDPKSWEDPNEFKPERFLDSTIDFRGKDFKFIPFGAGRRGCPGISFATAMNEIVLANLVNKFDWTLPDGMGSEDLDMTESNDFTIHRKTPLIAIAIPRSL